MQIQNLPPLQTIFKDKKYAWEVLASQVQLQLSSVAYGQQVAKLMSLYMQGVQTMNSVMDPRQAYFRTKLISLMGKQNVIKGLNTTPKKMVRDKNNKQKIKQEAKNNTVQKQATASVTPFAVLHQKKKEIQMRLAYDAQTHSPEALNKMIRQVEDKQNNVSRTVQNIIESHQRDLQDRIRKRKLRTTTARSNVDINQFDNQNQDVQMDHQNISCINIVGIENTMATNINDNNNANLKLVFSKKKVSHEFASSSQKHIQIKKEQRTTSRRKMRSLQIKRCLQNEIVFSTRRNSIDLIK